MVLERPDFWTTVGIGLALLSLVPGMTSVPSASHIEFKVSRFCALAAATLFLFKLALWGSEHMTVTRLSLVAILGALIAVSAAYALLWINRKEEATLPALVPVAKSTHSETSNSQGSTLEVTRGGKIDASGTVFSGDLNFRFAKVDGGFLNIPGATVTNKDGVTSLTPAHANIEVPPPTGEFSKISNEDLRAKVGFIIQDLQLFQKDFTEEMTKLIPSPDHDEEWRTVLAKYKAIFEKRFSQQNLSIASELLARIGKIEISEMSSEAKIGGSLILNKAFAGPIPGEASVAFLKALTAKLPRK